jgi:ureidoglycolate dehydrogenase (NAD+)
VSHPLAAGSVSVAAARLTAWGAACLQALGMAPAEAREVADSLVQTSLWGIDSHGIARLPHYCTRLANGTIRARPAVRLVTTGPCTAQLHGDQGHGIALAHRAMREAMALARAQGLGAVGVSDSSHCGAIGLYARAAARAGLIGIAFTHADKVASPQGGQRPFFGTNPIAIAFPREGGEPVCLDMATTSIPWNRVMNARREGHALPPDVALDAHGRATTDAQQAAAVTPLGGEHYGHKGYALALMIDLLCGPLHGNPWGPNIPSMFNALDQPRRLGAFLMAIDPLRFAGGATLASQVAAMAMALAAEPGEPRMPGDPQREHEQARRRHGIPVEPGLAAQFHELSARLGLQAPL